MKDKINKIVELIKENDNIALFHHVMIDGDSLSSSYGLAKAIKLKYPNKNVKVIGDIDVVNKRFKYLPKIDESFFTMNMEGDYLAIVGDCAVLERIEHNEIYSKSKSKIAYDHHKNDIDFETDVFWHEPTFIASSIQACLIAEALEIKLDEDTALNLVHGIITDSGRFSYSGADSLPLEVAARMYKYIKNETISKLFYSMSKRTLNDIKFESWVYSQLVIKEKVGYVVITKENQQKFNKTPDQSSRVNMIGNIEDEKAWLMFIEYPDFIRVEFRSSGVPVNEIAKQFGGGGHIKASGCKLKTLNEVDSVIKATIEAVKKYKK